ncbi:phosphocarrier protein HPr [Cytobacillus praedii]|uniref:phosphocarrier protein HPr n=1 Tax=Cytobacillus praedii TaxID=1742358 RepID=UPI003AF58209
MERSFKITASEGIHARPATLLVSSATPYKADVQLTYNNKSANLKSIMGVMAQGIPAGAIVTISAEGPDEAELLNKVEEVMVTQGLGEKC